VKGGMMNILWWKKKRNCPRRLRFKLPMYKNEVLVLNPETGDYYLEFVLDQHDEISNGRLVIVSKDQPKVRFEKNLEKEVG
jgi:hypothetical protein